MKVERAVTSCIYGNTNYHVSGDVEAIDLGTTGRCVTWMDGWSWRLDAHALINHCPQVLASIHADHGDVVSLGKHSPNLTRKLSQYTRMRQETVHAI